MKNFFLMCALAILGGHLLAAAEVLTVSYPASDRAGELAVESKFHLWLPPGVKRIRAVIVHQHGCGDGAEMSGETAALDWHWRALAARHDAALLSPHYSAKGGNCQLWCDPRLGSGTTFQRALDELGAKSGHPELATAPWCLWGHSGGGFWASLMLESHAPRIVAVFCRSGTAAVAVQRGEIPAVQYPSAAFTVPIVLNPGMRERGDKQFNGAWEGSVKFFEQFRAQNAPVVFAPDPLSSHDCRNSRLFAIPWFDACLTQRLPKSGSTLRPLKWRDGWLADWTTATTASPKTSTNASSLGWLPDAVSAKAFREYVQSGVTTDRTAPKSAPVLLRVERGAPGAGNILVWRAEADLESGIKQFAIYRDGQRLALHPEQAAGKTGFTQAQGLSYHDTPLPGVTDAMTFTDPTAPTNTRPRYAVSVINGAGLEGARSREVRLN